MTPPGKAPEPGMGGQARDPMGYSVRTIVHKLRVDIHVERQCRHCCTQVVTENCQGKGGRKIGTMCAHGEERIQNRYRSRLEGRCQRRRRNPHKEKARTLAHCSLKHKYGERTAAVGRHCVQSSEE